MKFTVPVSLFLIFTGLFTGCGQEEQNVEGPPKVTVDPATGKIEPQGDVRDRDPWPSHAARDHRHPARHPIRRRHHAPGQHDHSDAGDALAGRLRGPPRSLYP